MNTGTTAKILVVDDEDAGRFVKVERLRRSGFTVISASTGQEALKLAETEGPDLIVLDVNLPDISGLEVARRVRSSETGAPLLPILQISNTAVGVADRVRGLEHGADVYLTEPVDGEVLVATVHALLRVRRAEIALASALEREREARKVAEEANRLKDEFLATLSHELRTPLNAMMGWIWQLRQGTLGVEARQRALDSIERNAHVHAQLINDLLDVSRISKGKLQLEMTLVDLQQVVNDVVESVGESLKAKPIDLQLDLRPVWVAADHSRLQQIVTNLLTNAVQFTPAGGKIFVSLSHQGDDALLRVEDTGAGIDQEFLPFVFDQFKQGTGGMSRKHGGLGLGLSVVRQLIDLHGGSVTAESEGVGHGAAFALRLPTEIAPPSGSAAGERLLETVWIRIENESERMAMLSAAMESSGAHVIDESSTDSNDVEGSADEFVTIRVGRNSFSVTTEAGPREFALTTSPGEVVRQIGRLVGSNRVTTPPR